MSRYGRNRIRSTPPNANADSVWLRVPSDFQEERNLKSLSFLSFFLRDKSFTLAYSLEDSFHSARKGVAGEARRSHHGEPGTERG